MLQKAVTYLTEGEAAVHTGTCTQTCHLNAYINCFVKEHGMKLPSDREVPRNLGSCLLWEINLHVNALGMCIRNIVRAAFRKRVQNSSFGNPGVRSSA